MGMRFVPWRCLADWRCIACGDCCRLYSVVISFHEWLRIIRNFGVEQTASGLDKLFIKRRGDGSCAFLNSFSDTYSCGIQYMKPRACQIWPFKILAQPRFGYTDEAIYHYGKDSFFVYADPMCSGLRYGMPTREFANHTLKEFVEIAMGLRTNQCKTTANAAMRKPYQNLWFAARNGL
jgi:Fe-S-cluster containining protein